MLYFPLYVYNIEQTCIGHNMSNEEERAKNMNEMNSKYS